MDALFPYISLLGASACLILGIFILSRNPRKAANISFAIGMTLLAVIEFDKFLSSFLFWETSLRKVAKISLGAELILPVAWLVFSASPIQSAAAGIARVRTLGIGVVSLLSVFFFSVLVSGIPSPIAIGPESWQRWVSIYMIL